MNICRLHGGEDVVGGIKAVQKNESDMSRRSVCDESSATKNYCTVKIPAALAHAIDEYLRWEEAEVRGFRSRADVVVFSVVRFLESCGALKPVVKPRFEHVNVYESHVLVRDNLLDTSVEVWVQCDGLFCSYCFSSSCLHVGYASSLEEVRAIFTKHGRSPPIPAGANSYVIFLNGVAYPISID